MVPLPNGCRRSEFNVYPSTWEDPKAFNKSINWKVTYRFYDAGGNVRQVKHMGMNYSKTHKDRKADTKKLLQDLEDDLNNGLNPILSRIVEPVNPEYEIDPRTPLIKALRKALTKVTAEEKTKQDIKNVLTYIDRSAKAVKVDSVAISEVKRRHIKMILEHCGETKERWSANLFNHYRKYLNILFNQLVEYDSIEHNPIKEIKKQKAVKKIRKILTDEERKTVREFTRKHYYDFFVFLNIFYQSGSRISELLRIQEPDVNLKTQYFKVTIIKGKQKREVLKPITDSALFYWQRVMTMAKKGDYLFSRKLVPGPQRINPAQVSRRWRLHIKKKLGIDVDFYAGKHLHSDELAKAFGIAEAQKRNDHTSKSTTMIYAVNEIERQNEKLKKVGTEF